MILTILVFSLAVGTSVGNFPRRFGFPPPPPPPNCKPEIRTVKREFCLMRFEKQCKNETRTFSKVTGFEKGECREVEVCKPPVGPRPSRPEPCTKETRELCEKKPVVEEFTKDVEFCVPKPIRECEEREVEEPVLKCIKQKKEDEAEDDSEDEVDLAETTTTSSDY